MKKVLSLLTLLLAVCSGAWADEIITWKVDGTPTGGSPFQVKNSAGTENVLQIAFGTALKDAANDWSSASGSNTIKYNGKDYTFTKYAKTSNVNGNKGSDLKADGSSTYNYLAFVPKYDGTLIIGVVNAGNTKTAYCFEDGVKKNGVLIGTGSGTTEWDGASVFNSEANYTGGVKLTVSAEKLYTISVAGSKGNWMGVIYEYNPVAATQVATPTYSLGDWDKVNSKYAVTLNCGTAGATIKFSTDNKASYSDYSEALALAPGTTLDAYAVKTGLEDSEAMAQYTVPAAPSLFTITYANAEGATGIVPAAAEDIEGGSSITLPKNFTLYKDGYTLTGWNDGTDTYLPGASYTVTDDKTLTAVYTANTVSLAEHTSAVVLNFDFQQKNGAPSVQWQGAGKTGVWVTQANVNGSTIDVKMDWDATSGKINNSSWTDWAQLNGGTQFVIPSEKGATVDIEGYNNTDDETTVDGNIRASVSGNVSKYEVSSTTATVDVVMSGKASYYRYIKVTLPAPPMTTVINKMWNFSEFSDATYSATTARVGSDFELAATDKDLKINGSNKTIDEVNYTKRLQITGTGNTTKNHIHFIVSGPCKITVAGLSGSSSGDERDLGISVNGVEKKTTFSSTMTKAVYEYTGDEADAYVYSTNSGLNLYYVKVEPLTESVSTLADRNYATCVPTKKLDFSAADGITAYIATGLNGAGTAVVITPVDVVAAGTPIIVKTDTKGATVNVPVTTADADDVSSNLLVPGDGTTAWNGTANTTYYYLASDLFHKATSGTLQSGKAYLAIATGGARELGFVFADDSQTTGINAIENTKTINGIFNLNGQRVSQPTRGLYIVNGMKVIIK